MILKKDKINELLEKIIFFYNTPFDNLIIFFSKEQPYYTYNKSKY